MKLRRRPECCCERRFAFSLSQAPDGTEPLLMLICVFPRRDRLNCRTHWWNTPTSQCLLHKTNSQGQFRTAASAVHRSESDISVLSWDLLSDRGIVKPCRLRPVRGNKRREHLKKKKKVIRLKSRNLLIKMRKHLIKKNPNERVHLVSWVLWLGFF